MYLILVISHHQITSISLRCYSTVQTLELISITVCLVKVKEYFVWEEFEDTKGVIRIRISKKNRQHNDQKKKYKRTNNDLQNIHTQLKIE